MYAGPINELKPEEYGAARKAICSSVVRHYTHFVRLVGYAQIGAASVAAMVTSDIQFAPRLAVVVACVAALAVVWTAREMGDDDAEVGRLVAWIKDEVEPWWFGKHGWEYKRREHPEQRRGRWAVANHGMVLTLLAAWAAVAVVGLWVGARAAEMSYSQLWLWLLVAVLAFSGAAWLGWRALPHERDRSLPPVDDDREPDRDFVKVQREWLVEEVHQRRGPVADALRELARRLPVYAGGGAAAALTVEPGPRLLPMLALGLLGLFLAGAGYLVAVSAARNEERVRSELEMIAADDARLDGRPLSRPFPAAIRLTSSIAGPQALAVLACAVPSAALAPTPGMGFLVGFGTCLLGAPLVIAAARAGRSD